MTMVSSVYQSQHKNNQNNSKNNRFYKIKRDLKDNNNNNSNCNKILRKRGKIKRTNNKNKGKMVKKVGIITKIKYSNCSSLTLSISNSNSSRGNKIIREFIMILRINLRKSKRDTIMTFKY